MVFPRIKAAILDRINFNNLEQLEAVVILVTTSVSFAAAGAQFDEAFPDEDASTKVANGIIDLSDAFAELASEEKNQFIKDAFAAIFTGATPEQEVAGENLFAAGLDFDVAAKKVNALFSTPVVSE